MPAPANTSRHVGPNKQSLTSVIKEITENHDSNDKPPDCKTGFKKFLGEASNFFVKKKKSYVSDGH